ncbi:hypothetical protein MKW98_007860 [Papaver atlanticum]|uniref:PI3K/PI4K catalytic domain-containing protein n=1 Tax=Papaver atlanticum TaxID=357466 RepID=A0AAD4X7Z8_9MAGN|nr:hypothetical protein MKW98_007860 [Papaver atlanticum]
MAELSSLIHQLRERSLLLHHQHLLLHKQQIMELMMINQRIDFFLIFFSKFMFFLHPQYPDPLISFLIYIAVLKLLSHTSMNFTGIYFHREASVVIPFFGEPEFRSCHGVIFETGGSLLSLLAPIFTDSSTMTESPVVSLKCFHKSFGGMYSSPSPFGDLPACFRPTDGLGILINIISKCQTEGTLYMEGLTNASFVSAACPLLCYGDAALHIACFDFARVLTTVSDAEMFRWKILLSQSYVVELRAGDLVNAFAESLKNTDSLELKVAVFSAYVRISKTFSVHIWKPKTLVNMMYSPKLSLPMMDCLRIAIGILGPDFVGYVNPENTDIGISSGSDKTNQSSKVGDKRLVQNLDILQNKRQKVEEETLLSNINARVGLDCTMKHEQDKEHADPMRESLLSFVGLLKPSGISESMLTPETAHINPQRSLSLENILFRTMDVNADPGVVLMLPWTHLLAVTEADPIWKTKCLSVQVFSKIGFAVKPESVLEILDLALCDEAEEVNVEAVISIPMIVLCAGRGILPHMLRRLEFLGKKKCSNVNESVPFTLGCLTCLHGSVYANSATTCKLFLIDDINKKDQTTDILSSGFWCPKCDRSADHNFNSSVSLFYILLCDDSSEEAQAAHILLKTRSQWIKCLEFVLHNKKRSVREAFRGQIGYFLEIPSLTCLFGDVETSKKMIEQRFLDKLKHALAAVKDLEVFETLLEVIADIMNAVDIHVQLFFYSLIQWVDQLDNPHMVVIMDASRLIKRSCYFHLKGGIDILLLRGCCCITDELVRFQGDGDSNETTDRLTRVPAMIQEVARVLTCSDDLSGFLRNHFLVFLTELTGKQMLNELMGSHLSTCVPKIMVLLMHAYVISQAFAALMPFLEQWQLSRTSFYLNKVVEILEELVVENKVLLKLHIRELPLLPSIPELAEVKKVIQKSRVMQGCLKDLPGYQWLAMLAQLVSRICHQNEETVQIVKDIITSVLQDYPQQALWTMAAVSKSHVPARREAAARIIQEAQSLQARNLIDHLIRLCFHPGQPKARTINISTEFSSLKRMMPAGIIIPIQPALTVSRPMYENEMNTDPHNIDMFSASDLSTILGTGDEAEIISSLQKPKKVLFIGSDGVEHPFLCKPKDDLRKDARMMEFVSVINRLLAKYPESPRRELYIRTFAMIPLTEDCGIIDWVPHTRGLRHILQDIHTAHGKFDGQKTNPVIKWICDQCQGKVSEGEMLKTKILPLSPPISTNAFFLILQLAIVFTSIFSCLFEKGLQLEKHELNMIDGLGITGYECSFLKVCEITLSVLRTHTDILMSVLETFIHDPLVESNSFEQTPGQARRLIGEAISHENLGRDVHMVDALVLKSCFLH